MRAHVFTSVGENKWRPRIEYDVNAAKDTEALTIIGKEINQGDTKISTMWRSMGFPALTVGDLIVLDKERWWICEATGWKRTDRPESVPPEPGVTAESERKVRRQ